MNPKILECPCKTTNVPLEGIGKLTYDALKSYDQNVTAVVNLSTDESYTFGNLVDYSLNLAAGLKTLGIQKNDIIAIISENSHKFPVALLAGLYLAAPIHLLNPGYTKCWSLKTQIWFYVTFGKQPKDELKKMFELSKPKLVFCTKKSLKNLKEVCKEVDFVQKIVLLDDDVPDSIYNYSDLVRSCSKNFEIENNFEFDNQVALILNSSGTTGLPKGVMFTHNSVRLNYVHSSDPEIAEFERNESVILVVPFFHLYGCSMMLVMLYLGGKLLVMDQFNPELYLKTIEKQGVKKLLIVPSLANFLANASIVENFNVSSVNEIISAAAPPNEEIQKRLTSRFKICHIRQIYGLTELSAGGCMTPRTETKKGSCGKLRPGCYLKIIDTKTKEILGAHQPGEICITGTVMKGYINDPIKTNEIIDDEGFLHTGDVGYYDEDGYVYIIDRLKDLIKYKSFQVAPVELEDILFRHPAIKDAGVVGKPDERVGELPVAFVVKNEGIDVDEKEIVDFVAEHLCVEKRLHGGVKFVDHIPKNQIGKILRTQLREML